MCWYAITMMEVHNEMNTIKHGCNRNEEAILLFNTWDNSSYKTYFSTCGCDWVHRSGDETIWDPDSYETTDFFFMFLPSSHMCPAAA